MKKFTLENCNVVYNRGTYTISPLDPDCPSYYERFPQQGGDNMEFAGTQVYMRHSPNANGSMVGFVVTSDKRRKEMDSVIDAYEASKGHFL